MHLGGRVQVQPVGGHDGGFWLQRRWQAQRRNRREGRLVDTALYQDCTELS